MDPAAILAMLEGALKLAATLFPPIYQAIVGDGRTPEQVIADARAAVEAIPERPAGAALDAHLARIARAAEPTREIVTAGAARMVDVTINGARSSRVVGEYLTYEEIARAAGRPNAPDLTITWSAGSEGGSVLVGQVIAARAGMVINAFRTSGA